jgi:hypothetical protein
MCIIAIHHILIDHKIVDITSTAANLQSKQAFLEILIDGFRFRLEMFAFAVSKLSLDRTCAPTLLMDAILSNVKVNSIVVVITLLVHTIVATFTLDRHPIVCRISISKQLAWNNTSIMWIDSCANNGHEFIINGICRRNLNLIPANVRHALCIFLEFGNRMRSPIIIIIFTRTSAASSTGLFGCYNGRIHGSTFECCPTGSQVFTFTASDRSAFDGPNFVTGQMVKLILAGFSVSTQYEFRQVGSAFVDLAICVTIVTILSAQFDVFTLGTLFGLVRVQHTNTRRNVNVFINDCFPRIPFWPPAKYIVKVRDNCFTDHACIVSIHFEVGEMNMNTCLDDVNFHHGNNGSILFGYNNLFDNLFLGRRRCFTYSRRCFGAVTATIAINFTISRSCLV